MIKKIINITYHIMYILLAIVSILFIFDSKNYENLGYVVYVIFLINYIVNFVKSENRLKFFYENPLDIIMLLPFNNAIKMMGIFRICKIFNLNKLLKKKFPKIFKVFQRNNVGLGILWLISLLFIISIPITYIEPNMEKYSDAFWWCIVTTTTVGYGDIVPTTIFGKIIAVFLMIFGIGIVSLLTGNIANIFIKDKKEYLIPFELDNFEALSQDGKEKIMSKIKEEVELQLFKEKYMK